MKRRLARKIVKAWLASRETMSQKNCAAAGANYAEKCDQRSWRKGTLSKALETKYRRPKRWAIAWNV